jgi:hypothetical protein
MGRAGEVRPLFDAPIPCSRVVFTDGSSDAQVKFVDAIHGGREVVGLLREARPYGELRDTLPPMQRHVLMHMVLADMLEAQASASTPAAGAPALEAEPCATACAP